MNRTALILVALLSLLVLAPLAIADHAYSHRLVIYGRVLDADGKPFPGLTVSATPQGLETEGACGNQPLTETDAFGPTQTRPVTNEHGEFTFCIHAHRISRAAPGNIELRIAAHEYTQTLPVDPFLRVHHAFVKLQDARAPAQAPQLTDHTVFGRLWDPAQNDVNVENVPVYGTTIDRAPVNVTLTLANGTTLRTNTTTNNYGDFAVRFNLTDPAAVTRVSVDARDRTFEQDADASAGATFIRGEYGERPSGRDWTAIFVIAAVVIVGGGVIAYSFMRTPSIGKKNKSKAPKKPQK